jgi:hypothetical protein
VLASWVHRAIWAVLVTVLLVPSGTFGGPLHPSSVLAANSGTVAARPASLGPGAAPGPPRLVGAPAPTLTPVRRGAPHPALSAPNPATPSGLSAALVPASWAGTLGKLRMNGAPVYSTVPAPMGLADLGVGPSGPYQYTTSEFEAEITLSSFAAYSPGYASWTEALDWDTLSLDTVVENIPVGDSVSAAPVGVFWTENAVRFNGTEFQFEDNVWNFSSPLASVEPTTIENASSVLPAPALDGVDFYHHWGPEFRVSFPVTLTLANTLTDSGGRPEVDFNYTLAGPDTNASGSYDQVTFEQVASPSDPPHFVVNGSATTPFGLPEDAEFVFGGDGSGSNAMVDQLNGTASLCFWRLGSCDTVSSSYDYGEDSGGTSEGIAAYFEGTTEHLNAGPSFLYGLWNTSGSRLGPSASPGWVDVRVSIAPEFGLLLATNSSARAWSTAGNFSFAPTTENGLENANLPPPVPGDPYVFEAWADGFDPGAGTISGNASGNLTLSLVAAPADWNAPVYLVGDAQVAAFGRSGTLGVAYADGTLSVTNVSDSLSAPFLRLNDYLYPTFVLFATSGLKLDSVSLSRLGQGPGSSGFDWYGLTETLPGITQGYYFDGGNGEYQVDNTTVSVTPADSTLNPFATLPEPSPPAVEFYDTEASRAVNVSSVLTNGVVDVEGRAAQFANLSTEGGDAVDLFATETADVTQVSATGDVLVNFGGYTIVGAGTAVTDSNDTDVDGVDAGVEGIGVDASADQNLTVDRLAAVGGTGIQGNDLENVTLGWWNLTCEASGLACGYGGQLTTGTDLWLHNLSSVNSSGLGIEGWTGLRISDLFANGHVEPAVAASTVENLDNSTDGTIENLIAVNGAITIWYLTGDRNFSFVDLDGNDGGIDVAILVYSTGIRVDDIHLTNGSAGIEGSEYSSELTVSNVWTATGSEGVGGTELTDVDLAGAEATSGSLTLILLESQNVTVRDAAATNGSVSVSLADTNGVALSGIDATNLSVGVSWWTGDQGTVANLTASQESIEAQLAGLQNVSVQGVNDTNPVPGPAYFRNPFLGIVYPDAPLQTYTDQGLVVSDLTAVNCSFAIQDIFSDGLTISDVHAWESGTAVQLNGTEFATLDGLFAESDVHGLVLQSNLNVTMAGSTIEDSSGVAIQLIAGENETFYANNFVANDGASALGQYDPAHPQVTVDFTQNVTFTRYGVGNYWSDWSGTAAYPIGAGVSDSAPAPAFLTAWLEFAASGLAPGVLWGVDVSAHVYLGTAPLIVIPTSILPGGTFGYGLVVPADWGANPRSGTVLESGANETVTILFILPEYEVAYNETGLPADTTWGVSVDGASEENVSTAGGGSIVFAEPNGSYTVEVGEVAGYQQDVIASGSELVVQGADVRLVVPFTVVVYTLTWQESGLPRGTPWGVTFNGTFHGSNGSVVAWNASNGTYAYTLSGIPGWHESALAYRGTIAVTNGSQVVQLAWSPERYVVTFDVTGLEPGTTWTVLFAGQNLTVSGSTVSFDLPNGTYPYRDFATLPTTFAGRPPSGNVTVAGAAATVQIDFSPLPLSPPPSPENPFVVEGALIVAAAAVVVGVAILAHRRRGPPTADDRDEEIARGDPASELPEGP